ncbi:short-chain dehydrogenase [Pseudomonas sp. FSL R10-1350]|uniref:Short-chain dehydrogenase n=1 Tax=Pseudomonas helleri TaxID=1608996 RepID=A0A6A7YKC4_9PSED|nr:MULTISPECIES: short-chain dehydrogenase [Pseudomonas]MQT32841.1 short-chain dehydrogenase [Pseudomonas helleri]MQT49678.1 short-chain dehydrogenase [Pseudomonas helleri]MQT59429.1 short-chain dehydrogenase [Pseudomonas sp. FSL R10-0399]MQU64954.1 short-chain dehydrogenase [Pseudomonas sp. FSL R10-1350]
MNQYIPLTAIDCLIPSLLIDRQSPPDVLHANAAARILAVTQLFESLNRLDLSATDGVDLKHITQPCAILLRDGCDLLDVLGQRLQV